MLSSDMIEDNGMEHDILRGEVAHAKSFVKPCSKSKVTILNTVN